MTKQNVCVGTLACVGTLVCVGTLNSIIQLFKFQTFNNSIIEMLNNSIIEIFKTIDNSIIQHS